MGAMSDLHIDYQELQAEKDEAFGWYNHLLAMYSPATRTVAQDHEINEARQRALAAVDALDRFKFWEKRV
jgi:hypothetical protein